MKVCKQCNLKLNDEDTVCRRCNSTDLLILKPKTVQNKDSGNKTTQESNKSIKDSSKYAPDSSNERDTKEVKRTSAIFNDVDDLDEFSNGAEYGQLDSKRRNTSNSNISKSGQAVNNSNGIKKQSGQANVASGKGLPVNKESVNKKDENVKAKSQVTPANLINHSTKMSRDEIKKLKKEQKKHDKELKLERKRQDKEIKLKIKGENSKDNGNKKVKGCKVDSNKKDTESRNTERIETDLDTNNNVTYNEKSISFLKWIKMIFISNIPIIGTAYMFILLISKNNSETIKNWVIANLLSNIIFYASVITYFILS